MNNIISTKNASAIFLSTVLIAGTFAAISPSSFIIGANAQHEAYNYGMEDRYDIYGPQYPPEYKDKYYNGYEPDYEMDSYDKKLYRNDYNEQPKEYPSYKQDYNKPEYPQYGKDNSYKSNDNSYKSKKDSSNKKSVSLNKLNCINNNVNINGNNAGNVSIGNKGQAAYAEEGYSGAYSSGGYGSEGYSKQDKGFECLINNNNINNNFGAGNATDGNVTDTCEECFLDALGPTLLAQFEQRYLAIFQLDITEYCDASIQNEIESGISVSEIVDRIHADLNLAGIELDSATLAELEACLFELFG